MARDLKGVNMSEILKSSEIYIDNQESDDGYYSIGFLIDRKEAGEPNNIGFCRDDLEDPGWIYVEADDQIHGFKTKSITFSFEGLILSVELLDDNKFYWNGEKSFKISILEDKLRDVEEFLECMSIF